MSHPASPIACNAFAGVSTRSGGEPNLRRSRISNNGHYAICVFQQGSGTFEDNDLRGNTLGAWSIAEDSLDQVKRKGNLED